MITKSILLATSIALILTGCMDPSRPLVGEKVAGRYSQICLEGHVYYSVTSIQSHDWMNIESIAPKLNDDGTPAACKGTP
jgi:hypothetical protein